MEMEADNDDCREVPTVTLDLAPHIGTVEAVDLRGKPMDGRQALTQLPRRKQPILYTATGPLSGANDVIWFPHGWELHVGDTTRVLDAAIPYYPVLNCLNNSAVRPLPSDSGTPDSYTSLVVETPLRDAIMKVDLLRQSNIFEYNIGILKFLRPTECACGYCTRLLSPPGCGSPVSALALGPVCVPVIDLRYMPTICQHFVWALWGSMYFPDGVAGPDYVLASDDVKMLWGLLGPGRPDPIGVLFDARMILALSVPRDVLVSLKDAWWCGDEEVQPLVPKFYVDADISCVVDTSYMGFDEVAMLAVDADTRDLLRRSEVSKTCTEVIVFG